MRRRIKIIVNPISGRGRALKRARRVMDLLRSEGCEIELAETACAGDARRLAGQVEGFDAVACVGGDGTVNEVLNGLPERTPPLGVIPSGTANVLAKEIRLPLQTTPLAETLARGREIPWDLGIDRVSGRKFLLFVSTGYDAYVVHVFHRQRRGPIHMWQYILWGLKSMVEFDVPRIGVELDGKVLTRDASWIQVSNVACYGGPLVFTPRAKVDDGLFEVMVYHARRRRDTPRMFFRAILGWLTGWEYRLHDLSFHTARRVRLWSEDGRPVPTQVDGDPGAMLPADLEVHPGGMKILAPPS